MSSRRKTVKRAQPSSDIEDQQSTQTDTREDVDDDEEEQPRRAAKSVKQGKKPATKKKAKADSDKEDQGPASDDDDDEDLIDVNNFKDHPIRQGDMAKLRDFANYWTQVAPLVQSHAEDMGDIGAALVDVAEGDEAKKSLTQLDLVMKELIDIQNEFSVHHQSLDGIYQNLAQKQEVVGVAEIYNTAVRQKLADYSKKTTRQKYAKNDQYQKFKQALYEVDHPSEAMPPMTDFIPKESGDVSDDDDDLEVGGVTQDYKCPITLTLLEDPVTSTVCRHSFSQKAIQEMFRSCSSSTAKFCPSAGCHQEFKLSDCKPNKELQKKIRIIERRERRREEDADDGEVIE